MKFNRGFTLVEMLTVVAVISVLAVAIFISVSSANDVKRDAQRKADLRTVQAAIELYKLKYGTYPAGCRGPGVWSGQPNGGYYTGCTGDYIIGLAPEFIPKLPIDPKLNGSNSGYVYAVSSDGGAYKFAALRTVEKDLVLNFIHEMRWCDVNGPEDNGGVNKYANTYAAEHLLGICNATAQAVRSSRETPPWCQPGTGNSPTTDQRTYRTSYAVWGGVATETTTYRNRLGGLPAQSLVEQTHGNVNGQRNTEAILCELR